MTKDMMTRLHITKKSFFEGATTFHCGKRVFGHLVFGNRKYLAIKVGGQAIRVYLPNRLTLHCAEGSLRSRLAGLNNTCLKRWSLSLQLYCFKVIHQQVVQMKMLTGFRYVQQTSLL